MELRIWKRIYLTPFIRLNLYTRGLTISFGHRGLGRTARDLWDAANGYPRAYLSCARGR
jgi:hypothetical protein